MAAVRVKTTVAHFRQEVLEGFGTYGVQRGADGVGAAPDADYNQKEFKQYVKRTRHCVVFFFSFQTVWTGVRMKKRKYEKRNRYNGPQI